MSIVQKDIVDSISSSPDGKIVLTISDHLLWDQKNEHLVILQEKLNTYIRFIESGEILKSYPAAKDNAVTIQVYVRYEPNEIGLRFLSRCNEVVVNAGIGFNWRLV